MNEEKIVYMLAIKMSKKQIPFRIININHKEFNLLLSFLKYAREQNLANKRISAILKLAGDKLIKENKQK